MIEKANISTCLIVKNEEAMLPDCLESVKEISNEIIVVDTGSQDNTIAVAQRYGCKVIKQAWEDDFAKARNIALVNARFPYILSIDADERVVNPELFNEIIMQSPRNTGGWLLQVVSHASRGDGGTDMYTSSLLRLFINHPAVKFSGEIHEQIIQPVLNLGLNIQNTPIVINHLGYSYSSGMMEKKQKRNLELLNKVIEKNPTDAYMIFQRAKTYMALNNLTKAEEDTRLSLQFAAEGSITRPSALNFGAVIAYQTKNMELALSRTKESLSIVPEQAFAYFIMGETYSLMNKHKEALEAYKKAEEYQKNPSKLALISGDYNLPEEQMAFRFGRSLQALNYLEEAEAEFKRGNKINPKEIGNLVGLANVEFIRQDLAKAEQYLNDAINIQPDNPQLKMYKQQLENAKLSFQSAEQFPNPVLTPNINEQSRVLNPEKPLLSLSMIVKDEEENLRGCLESVKEIADEIIIVDTGSNDKTKEIASEFGANIYDFKWLNDFSAARNESLKHCKGEWILYLDADERIEISDSVKFRNFLANLDKKIGGLLCTIESPHAKLDGDTEMHRGGYPRLFRNLGFPKINFIGRVHEQITPSLFNEKMEIVFSDIKIKHLGYNQSREVMEAKIKRNYQMLMEHIKEDPLNGYAWYQLGQTLAQMNLVKEAEEAIKFAVKNSKLSPSIYASAAATLSQLTGNNRNFEEALYWAEQSLSTVPNQVYALYLKAFALLYMGKPEEAESVFLEVLKRLRNQKGVPKTGFDIEIPEELVNKGLTEARLKKEEK